MTLQDLTPEAKAALLTGLLSLPDDRLSPVPLCERVAQVLDAIGPLTRREDLPPSDRKILLTLLSDKSLDIWVQVVRLLDLLRDQQRKVALDELSEMSQEFGGYDDPRAK